MGYRPFVYRLARRFEIGGYVLNDARGVTVEAQGSAAQLKRFSRALDSERPPLALIDQVLVEELPSVAGAESGAPLFQICENKDPASEERASDSARAGVTVDSAVCGACLKELVDRGDRRHGYGLINCTDCGPRYTIIDEVPYDRPHTTMRGFELCASCGEEYTDPSDRRYHAQPIACHDCGPRVGLVDAQGVPLTGDPIEVCAALLASGKIVAIKGLGGFHLAVRADDERAVSRLRQSKQRDGKPFALMCQSIRVVRGFVKLGRKAQALMRSGAAPIVLAERRCGAVVVASVAPDSHRLGVMLPYTPIHHLLFAGLGPGIDALVMTSANPSGEPLTIDNDEALSRLSGLCDAILWHDRPIRRRVDDSVYLDMGGADPLPLRRARGFVPGALGLAVGGDVPGLCVGGELKNTVALVRDGGAVLSQHLGDLSYTPVFEHFGETIGDMMGLFDVRPAWIAHDLHPRYLGTVYAKSLAKKLDVPLIGVQHHHAHAASVMAEHGEAGPVLAVVCDGVGYGSDGTSWGGELLLADLTSFKRLAHLRPISLAGGDAAAQDTRRCGLALLYQVYGDDFAEHPAAVALVKDPDERRMLAGMLVGEVNCVSSSAAGRYFDGVAALLGLSTGNAYEAQAAMRVETAAYRCETPVSRGPLFHVVSGEPGVIDLSPLIGAVVAGRSGGVSVEALAALFHDQLAWALADSVLGASRRLGVTTAVLSGGVFCNQRLMECLVGRLSEVGLRVLVHGIVPGNDGGLAFGQAAVAAARLKAGLNRKVGV